MILNEIHQATLTGRASEVEKLTKQALASALPLDDIINEGFISAMRIVGEKFKKMRSSYRRC